MAVRHRILVLGAILAGLCGLLAASVLYSNLTRKRGIVCATEETPASNVRLLLTAVFSYQAGYKVFPPALSSLGPPAKGQQESGARGGFIGVLLASGTKNGYVYRYIPTAGRQTGRIDSFTITADPINAESPDQPHYFSDQTGVVRVESGRTAAAVSPPDERDTCCAR
jgi:hypothetical protein